ncbi:MAG: DinB family protein [Gemmatimonadota bacterium]
MVPRQPWFQRRFSFDLPVSAAAGIIERLRGTPARLRFRLAGLTSARLVNKIGTRWSIQENAGHLADIEPLWMERIEDVATGAPSMHPADLDNHKTENAHHNGRDLREILDEFQTARLDMVGQLELAEATDWSRSALDSQLHSAMRLIDLAYYIAEHDDHHLATMTELLRFSA